MMCYDEILMVKYSMNIKHPEPMNTGQGVCPDYFYIGPDEFGKEFECSACWLQYIVYKDGTIIQLPDTWKDKRSETRTEVLA